MFDIDLSGKEMEELTTFFQTTPDIIEKILKQSRKKAGFLVRKIQAKHAENKYVNSKKSLNSKTHKVKTNSKETLITALTKKNKLDNFYVSISKPEKGKISARVRKDRSPVKLNFVFWAYYKNKKSNLGLYKRVSKNRKDIKPIRTVSAYSMALMSENKNILLEDEIQEIFFRTLEEEMYKEL